MTKNIKILLFISSIFFFPKIAKTQTDNDNSGQIYINPMITIGYSFGSGFTYGIDITYGFAQIQTYGKNLNIAISTKLYLINLNGYANRALAINLVAENQNLRIGWGFAQISRHWGFKNRNISKTYGPSTDFGLHFGNQRIPWIGLKTIFPKFKTDWYERQNSISLYTYYRLQNIIISKK